MLAEHGGGRCWSLFGTHTPFTRRLCVQVGGGLAFSRDNFLSVQNCTWWGFMQRPWCSGGAAGKFTPRWSPTAAGSASFRFTIPVQIRVVSQTKGLVTCHRRRTSPSPGSVRSLVCLWGAANELCLIFMKLHGKLLIWARNESVEPDRLMNIHPRLQHAGVDQLLGQPARLVTQRRARYLGRRLLGNLSPLSRSVSPSIDGADS